MKAIYKILGKKGRITIPWQIRRVLGFTYSDVVSFEIEGSAVQLRREKLCEGCTAAVAPDPKSGTDALAEILDSLTPDELRTALIRLSVRWAEMTAVQNESAGGDPHA